MIKLNRIAYGVRVKLNSQFQEKCLGDKYLKEERILFIADEKPYNDSKGYYVNVKGGSLVNSGQAYLNEIDLEFEVPERPLYAFDEPNYTNEQAAKRWAVDSDGVKIKSEYSFVQGCKFKEEQIRGKTKF